MSNENLNINRLINSVGTETFIKYFYEFQQLSKSDLKLLFDKNNENWKDNSKVQKANNGKRIFEKERELEALEYIILKKNENNIPNGTWVKRQAEFIYKNYNYPAEPVREVEPVSPTEKKVLIKYRLQQGKFRKNLLIHWDGCSITGCKNSTILIASHIKPYSESNDDEKYDLYNGLLLTPTFDKLFDSFLISFNEKGEILISESLDIDDLKSINMTGKEKLRMEKVTESTLKYLEYQRKKFEFKENTTANTRYI